MFVSKIIDIQNIVIDSKIEAITIKARLDDRNSITFKTIKLCYTSISNHINRDDYPVLSDVEKFIYTIDDIVTLFDEFGISYQIFENKEIDMSEVCILLRNVMLGKKVKIYCDFIDEDSLEYTYSIQKIEEM